MTLWQGASRQFPTYSMMGAFYMLLQFVPENYDFKPVYKPPLNVPDVTFFDIRDLKFENIYQVIFNLVEPISKISICTQIPFISVGRQFSKIIMPSSRFEYQKPLLEKKRILPENSRHLKAKSISNWVSC